MKILIILIAMVGTVMGAYRTYASRNHIIEAALLSEAYTLTAPIKTQVADHFLQNGVMPSSNAEVGLAMPEAIFGTRVKRVAVSHGGVLRVDLDEEIGKADLVFTPIASADGVVFSWRCSSDSLEPVFLEKLRPVCSHLPSTQESQLMKAIANHNFDRLEQLINANADVNGVVDGNTPLMLAAALGNVFAVRLLAEKNATIDYPEEGTDQRTPLMAAIASNHLEAASILLNHGASVLRMDSQGKSALDYAKDTDALVGGDQYEHRVTAGLNLEFEGKQVTHVDVDVDVDVAQALDTELINALRSCDALAVQAILKANPNLSVSESGDKKQSYFDLAVHSGCTTIASELIAQHSLKGTLSPILLIEVIQGEPHNSLMQTIEVLVEAGIDVNAKSSGGETALVAAIACELPSIAKFLIDAGADVNERSAMGSYAVVEASKKGYQQLVSQLITAGADIDRADAMGRTALIVAVAQGKPALVETLLIAGANPNKRDNDGFSARIIAQSSSNRSIRNFITATASN